MTRALENRRTARGRVRQAVASRPKRELGEDYVVEVKPAGEVEAYDPASRMFDLPAL